MMHKIKEMLYRELEEYANVERLSGGSLELINKITDTIKNIDKIEMLEEGGEYSRDGGMSYEGGGYDDGVSYARRRGGMHYVRGHYSRDGGNSYGRDGGNSYNRGYSRHDGKQHMMQRMEEMMHEAENDRERDVLRRCMDQLGKME